MEASPMILCRGVAVDMMGHSLWLWCDLKVKRLAPVFKFSADQEGRLGGPAWHLDCEK